MFLDTLGSVVGKRENPEKTPKNPDIVHHYCPSGLGLQQELAFSLNHSYARMAIYADVFDIEKFLKLDHLWHASYKQAVSWSKRLGARLPPLRWGPKFASRSVHVGFVVDETGSGQICLGVSPVFPYHKFNFTPISSVPVMVRQAWSASTLAIH